MSIDKAQEQHNNMVVKGPRYAMGHAESPSAFTLWMVAGLELSSTLT